MSLWDHPDLDDWRYEVANGDTLRGFSDWLADRDETTTTGVRP